MLVITLRIDPEADTTADWVVDKDTGTVVTTTYGSITAATAAIQDMFSADAEVAAAFVAIARRNYLATNSVSVTARQAELRAQDGVDNSAPLRTVSFATLIPYPPERRLSSLRLRTVDEVMEPLMESMLPNEDSVLISSVL
jgi:hypothetical protein